MTHASHPPRTESLLNPHLSKRLIAYATAASAAGVGALALVSPAEAKIVYTRVNKPLGHLVTVLDINNDGIPDFGFCNGTFYARVPSSGSTCALARRLERNPPDARRPSPFGQWLSIFPPKAKMNANRAWGSSTWRGGPAAAPLAAGVSVGPQLKFTAGARIMATWGSSSGYPHYGGPWKNAAHTYVGLRFLINGQVHYGWARLNVHADDSGVSATLTGYAYETIANKPILTGNIVGPAKPKNVRRDATRPSGSRAPASLGLLAIGAEGLVAWRREDEND
jgi:hypothetical protein